MSRVTDVFISKYISIKGFPGWLSGEESSCKCGDVSLIAGLGRFPGEGNDNLLQYSYLGIPMDRGAGQAIVMGL